MAEQINLIDEKMLGAKLHLGRTAIYDRLNPASPHYDPDFPKPIKIGSGKKPRNRWIEAEADSWIMAQAEKTRAAVSRRAA